MLALEMGVVLMKKFRFDTICNITQEQQELYGDPTVSVCSSAMFVIKYHQLLSKTISIKGKSRFDQLATAYS